jgi:hypothetical protein
VYTPALIVNGRGWRPGIIDDAPETGTRPAGSLTVRLDGDMLEADFEPLAGDVLPLRLHIALLGMGLESRITAGENAGRISRHEFVVIGFKSLPAQNGQWQTRLPASHVSGDEPRALAVWVTRSHELKPLQAVGGYLN